jgi:hypothetical protein
MEEDCWECTMVGHILATRSSNAIEKALVSRLGRIVDTILHYLLCFHDLLYNKFNGRVYQDQY